MRPRPGDRSGAMPGISASAAAAGRSIRICGRRQSPCHRWLVIQCPQTQRRRQATSRSASRYISARQAFARLGMQRHRVALIRIGFCTRPSSGSAATVHLRWMHRHALDLGGLVGAVSSARSLLVQRGASRQYRRGRRCRADQRVVGLKVVTTISADLAVGDRFRRCQGGRSRR